jgi:hypothetical protein
MHWKDRLLLTWGFASAILFNANLAMHGVARVHEWWTLRRGSGGDPQ